MDTSSLHVRLVAYADCKVAMASIPLDGSFLYTVSQNLQRYELARETPQGKSYGNQSRPFRGKVLFYDY